MFKYIILFLLINLCCVICDLNKDEGAECEWEGVKGQCVKETRCMTTLDTRSPKPPVCSTKGKDTIICCTDCKLVNDTSNVVFSPHTGIFWKDGTKARDNCLTYIDTLPYRCRSGGFYSGIRRQLNTKDNCHMFGIWGIGGSPPPGSQPGAKYPHQVLLGYGKDLETAKWHAGGTLISDKYILTAAHTNSRTLPGGELAYVALGVKNQSDPPSSWQTHKVKRFVAHPEYRSTGRYYDIALIETEEPVVFSRDVLPACLQVEDIKDDEAVTTTWRNLESEINDQADTIQTIQLEKFSQEECNAAYKPSRTLENGVDFTTQLCYGSKSNPSQACKGFSGEPLLVETQFSCAYTVIGVTSFGNACRPNSKGPDVYTRVGYYVPWIESIVWPEM